jgi:hypothetical protein
MQGHITERWVKVLAEALGWSLVPGKEGLSGLLHHRKPTQNGVAEADGFIHHLQLEYPCSLSVFKLIKEWE